MDLGPLADELIEAIQYNLTSDLLAPRWRKQYKRGFRGHCYVASEALYHLLGGKASGYKPHVSSGTWGTHWWLENENGIILDPTAEQFHLVALRYIYRNGRGCGFLTKGPSKRTQILLQRLKLYGFGSTGK